MTRRFTLAFAFAAILALSAAAPAAAAQPNQSCQAQPMTPGNAASAPGSAFNTAGVAGTHYAGTQPQNSTNPKSVSQYDVACFQVSR
jgi:opacity protein-like surface antigen